MATVRAQSGPTRVNAVIYRKNPAGLLCSLSKRKMRRLFWKRRRIGTAQAVRGGMGIGTVYWQDSQTPPVRMASIEQAKAASAAGEADSAARRSR
jgi:hypothetical protein